MPFFLNRQVLVYFQPGVVYTGCCALDVKSLPYARNQRPSGRVEPAAGVPLNRQVLGHHSSYVRLTERLAYE